MLLSFACSVFFLIAYCSSITRGAYTETVGDFRNPGNACRPKFRYWLPDASVSHDVLTSDIAGIAGIGAGGIQFVPFYLYGLPGGGDPPTDWSKYGFGTTEFNNVFRDALQAAEEAGILVDFALGASQGQGVPSAPMTPGLAVDLLMGGVNIEAGREFLGPVPPATRPSDNVVRGLFFHHPQEEFGAPNLTAVTALRVIRSGLVSEDPQQSQIVLDEDSFIDLAPFVSEGSLKWTAPEGNSTWRIFSFWEHYTNQRSSVGGVDADTVLANGSWTVDHFSKTGAKRVTDFWDENILMHNEILNLLNSVGKYAWEDSIEMLAALYWTPGLLQRFEKERNYSLVKCLPAVFGAKNTWGGIFSPYNEVYSCGKVTTDGESVYNLDYRSFLNTGYQEYMSHFAEWTHAKGLKYSHQPAYNLPLQMLSDVPFLDSPEAESLGFGDQLDAFRQITGPAHLSGSSTISIEVGGVSYAAYGQSIPDLLSRIKRSLAGGITMHIIHGSPYSGNYPNTTWPGYTGFEYQFTDMWSSNQPCWRHMKETLDYIGRNQYVLQLGVPKVDLAFYSYASPWRPSTQYPSANLQDLGYTYEYLSPENLLLPEAIVQSRTLASAGPAYKALIISNQSTITVEAVEAVIRFSNDGLPVIIIGPAPTQTYPCTESNHEKLARAMASLISQSNVHSISSPTELPRLLDELGIRPLVSLSCSSNPVYPVWRSSPQTGEDYVYLYNDQLASVKCNIIFATNGDVVPYILNAWTGEQDAATRFEATLNGIGLEVRLEARETIIIAFQAESLNEAVSVEVNSYVESWERLFSSLTGASTARAVSEEVCSFELSEPKSETLKEWDISIEDWHASVDQFSVKTEIVIHNFTSHPLVPWTQLGTGFDAVSGVGWYRTTFTAPEGESITKLGATLSLGIVVHTMRVWIDGVLLPPVDPAKPTLDISKHIQQGRPHELGIEVTTPLFNRVKSVAGQTKTWTSVAGEKNNMYYTLPPQQYGLLGPVVVRWTDDEKSSSDFRC